MYYTSWKHCLTQELSMQHSRTTGLFNDFTNALAQQLFFWGQDVIHPDGNLLCKYGFEKRKSHGKQSTSCYRISFEGDTIELHGLCVGSYSYDRPSFLFTRYPHRCWIYEGEKTPAPGMIDKNKMNGKTTKELEAAAKRFLAWLLDYEDWITLNTEENYRKNCYKLYKKMPTSKVWLEPDMALSWLKNYFHMSHDLKRAKQWKHQEIISQQIIA